MTKNPEKPKKTTDIATESAARKTPATPKSTEYSEIRKSQSKGGGSNRPPKQLTTDTKSTGPSGGKQKSSKDK